MSSRDPRIDPRPGDVVQHRDDPPCTVYLVQQINTAGHTRVTFFYGPADARPRRMLRVARSGWRSMTRGDAVLVVAP